MPLEVTIYPLSDDDPIEKLDCEYVSLINQSTYGPPPVIAPTTAKVTADGPRATQGQTVVYINTALVPVFSIARK